MIKLGDEIFVRGKVYMLSGTLRFYRTNNGGTGSDFEENMLLCRDVLRDKEIIVADHIRKAAPDGCECEPCIAAREAFRVPQTS